MGKIAETSIPLDAPGELSSSIMASGPGWKVSDVLCSHGPQDRVFEERHEYYSIALVVNGVFQYRSTLGSGSAGNETLSPGSFLLGNYGYSFQCSHLHNRGDRCISFGYSPEFFEECVVDAGLKTSGSFLPLLRIPPLKASSLLVARILHGFERSGSRSWEEIGVEVATHCAAFSKGLSRESHPATIAEEFRVTRVLRRIEREFSDSLSLDSLAKEAGVSRYHFLRIFEQIAGVTPHQYLLRMRLRKAASLLVDPLARVLDVALESGFGDISNFNNAFRREFGMSPRIYRKQMRGV